MFRLFKSIRKTTLNREKILNYILYALGETFLVVVGILIAVKIGDINDDRKKAENFSKTLNQVEKDLKADIELYEVLLSSHEWRDLGMSLVLQNKLTIDDYRKDKSLALLITNYSLFPTGKDGFEVWQMNIDDKPKRYDSLYKELSVYYKSGPDEITEFLQQEMVAVRSTLKSWEENYDWYYKLRPDTPIDDEMLKYLASNAKYKNRTLTFYSIGKNILFLCSDARVQALEILLQMKLMEGTESVQTIPDFINLLAIRDTVALSNCIETAIPYQFAVYETRINSVSIVKNELDIPVKVYHNHDFQTGALDTKNFNVLIPNDFMFVSNDQNQIIRITNNAGECIGQFKTGMNNSLAIIKK
jgi:hypothetical protein